MIELDFGFQERQLRYLSNTVLIFILLFHDF